MRKWELREKNAVKLKTGLQKSRWMD